MKKGIAKELAYLLENQIVDKGYVVKNYSYKEVTTIHKSGKLVANLISDTLEFSREQGLEKEQAFLMDLFNDIKKMYYLYKEASPLPFTDPNNYRLISSFNDTLLCVQKTQYNDYIFATWKYNYDRKGINCGNYFSNNFEAAKIDFLQRSELLDKNSIFNENECVAIYDSLIYRGVHDTNISFEDEQELIKITSKVSRTIIEMMKSQDLEQKIEGR